MDLRIVTAFLIFLSLSLHTKAQDESENQNKQSGAFKNRRNFDRVPEGTTVDEKVTEEVTESEKEIPFASIHTKTYIPKDKNEGFLKQTINSQEIIRKNQIEIVNSAESDSQIEEPFVASAKSDENSKNMENVLVKKEEPLDEPSKIIKEIIFIRGVSDIRKLLENIVFGRSEEEISQREDESNGIDIPEESKESVIELRKELGKDTLYQESNESHEESMESRNINQRKMQENEISGEEITSTRVIAEENRRFGKQRKHSGEEIDEEYIYANTKPNKIKKSKLRKNKHYRGQLKVKKHNGNNDFEQSIATDKTNKHIINKNNISSPRKKIKKRKENKVEEVISAKGNKRKNNINEENGNFGEQRKQSDEEIDKKYIYANTKPSKMKTYKLQKNKENRGQLKVKKYSGNKDFGKSIATERIEKHIVKNNNISSLRKKHKKRKNRKGKEEKEEVIPTKGINRKSDITEENRNYGEQGKHSGEEIDEEYIYANAKPNTIKKYKLRKDKDDGRKLKEQNYNGNKDLEKSIATERIEKHIIKNNNIPSLRKKIKRRKEKKVEEKIIPSKVINRKNNISKSNRKMQISTETENYDLSAPKQLEEELIEEDVNKSGDSKESMELDEHVDTRNMNSEPVSIEKYIYIENNHPLLRNYFVGEDLVAEETSKKYGIQTTSDEQEEEIVRDYIIVKNKKYPSQSQLKESIEIIENTYDDDTNRKSGKIC